MISSELFSRYIDENAIAIRENIYIRRESLSLFSDIIHEGTHALDYANNFGQLELKSIRIWELRAFTQERIFQLNSGSPLEFSSVEVMLKHIKNNYPNIKYNPYD